jgi:hypothetical protein
MHKLLAVESGSDWYDANVSYLINISQMSGKELYDKFKAETIGHYGLSFNQWLLDHGYVREANENEIEIVVEN